jgi:hypothetical protein
VPADGTRTGQEAADYINKTLGLNVPPGEWEAAGLFWAAAKADGLNPVEPDNKSAMVSWYPDYLIPEIITICTVPINMSDGMVVNFPVTSIIRGSSLIESRTKEGQLLRITSYAPKNGTIVRTGIWSPQGKKIG